MLMTAFALIANTSTIQEPPAAVDAQTEEALVLKKALAAEEDDAISEEDLEIGEIVFGEIDEESDVDQE